jgi:outer membrane protein assembly factor BamB
MNMLSRTVAILSACFLITTAAPAFAREAQPGGLVCVVGDDDTQADRLAKDSAFLVHQLVEPNRVAARRKAAAEAGLLGRLVVEEHSGDALPYPDRFLDLLVISKGHTVAEAERQRVLAVEGLALLPDGKTWKPKADTRIDEWTHKWHGPDGNPLSLDQLSGPPTAIQWAAGPMFADGAVGGKAPRLGGGAFVHVDTVDRALVARSAANGLPRWRLTEDFSQTADLVIADGRVLAHVKRTDGQRGNTDEAGPLTAFDLATGKEVSRYDKGLLKPSGQGKGKELGIAQFVAQGDGILQAIGPEMVWLEAKSGTRRWEKSLEGASWFSPIILGDRVIAAETEEPVKRARLDNSKHARAIAAFDLASGKQLWRVTEVLPPEVKERGKSETVNRVSLSPLVGGDGIVLLHGGTYQSRLPNAFVAALDATNGKELWRHQIDEYDWTNTVESSRVVLLKGTAYYLGGKGVAAWDARTGKEKFPFHKRPKYAFNGFGECSGSRCTVNWLMANGLCYWDLEGKLVTTTWAARSSCGTGVFPAYGMVFALPTGCDCASYSRGYLGMSCSPLPEELPEDSRLVKGPAFGKVEAKKTDEDDWPTFLHDPQRTSYSSKALPEKLVESWTVKVADPPKGKFADDRRLSENYLGPLSAPVVVGDAVLVTRAERHQVVCLDAKGKQRWEFTAGGLIDSPPTVHEGLALFGSHDGRVYALRLSDGELAWRFTAAPVERKALLHGQLSSAFPVHGSVLVLKGRLIATAGFHSDLGGIHTWVLDPATGMVLARKHYKGSAEGQPPALNDILGANAEGGVGWLRLDAGFTSEGEVVKGGKNRNAIAVENRPVVTFDRDGACVRFPHDFRGGSTHGWKGGMIAEMGQSHRVCVAGKTTYTLADLRDSDRHPVRSDMVPVVRAFADDPKQPLWSASCKSLGAKESYGAVVRAGERLYLGGGNRDGSAGFVQVLDATTGKLLAEYALPGRVVECGLVAAGGRLYVSCEDGTLACLAGR